MMLCDMLLSGCVCTLMDPSTPNAHVRACRQFQLAMLAEQMREWGDILRATEFKFRGKALP